MGCYEIRQDTPPFWHIYEKKSNRAVMCWLSGWEEAARWKGVLEEMRRLT